MHSLPFFVGWLLATAETLSPSQPPYSPYLEPEFRTLMDAVTFHLSFDGESMLPDLAEGDKFIPRIFPSYNGNFKKPLFEERIAGKALVLGTGSASYPVEGNVPFRTRGAIAFRVKPLEWKRPNDSNVLFVMTGDSTFYIERQGPLRKNGKIRRQESVLYLVKATREQKLFTCLYGGVWQNGKWYLLVANWSWPVIQLSVNASGFSGKSLPQRPVEGLFTSLVVGSRGGSKALLDELVVFRRPISPNEVHLLYSLRRKSTSD